MLGIPAMTHYTNGFRAVQDAVTRVVDGGSPGDKVIALVVAFVNVIFFHPASWLLAVAGVLSLIDWLAGREKARTLGTYSATAAKAGLNSKWLSWILLLVIWLLTVILMRLGTTMAVDLTVTWVLPVFFTLKFMLEELHSIDENLDHPRWLQPLIDFLDGITKSIALRQPKKDP